MPLELFSHNRAAYDAAISMLAETGKAAVIHPTGTGKSFIGFRLAADHPDARVCWLSPSDYIIRTQVENLQEAGGAPKNIQFFTYAKLILMTQSELDAIRPDYIVLDEFHRCGAEVWGQGVQTLLNTYSGVPILGLSATNIRYLDSQRDMADELFDGNVASQMTLGEAIVRGILNPPTYVISAYIYQKEYDKLQQRVDHAKNQAVRKSASRYLEALRRTLDQTEGLDQVFDKHMTDRHGKYIVFCSNREHMDQLVEKVTDWFSRVDPQLHIYRVYADHPEAEGAFRDFKQDSSEHLKLLFCIDMLNEGIHVDGVSGVILFRPTISPIIYKQQIGRVLSAKGNAEPVIFDIVNNFENLYSIGTIEEEMETAITSYRANGRDGEICVERFQIIDEVLECRQLFTQLEQTLSASWELMYQYARQYYRQTGNLEIPRRYRTPEGYALGNWVQNQRKVRRSRGAGILTDEQIQRLDAIGMRWESAQDLTWEHHLAEAEAYYREHGNLDVPVSMITASGFCLGAWISQLRCQRRGTKRRTCLNAERIRQLDRLGMVWDTYNASWHQYYQAAAEYYREHGNLDVPTKYVTADGLRLGVWISRTRCLRAGTLPGVPLTEEEIRLLDGIGMEWRPFSDVIWERGYEKAKEYFAAHGNLRVPVSYVCEDGFPLGGWLANHRDGSIQMTPERREKLDALGMVWGKRDYWQECYSLAKAYFAEHGNLEMPSSYIVDGIWLQRWVNDQRKIYWGKFSGKKLTQVQIRALEAIGMDWRDRPERIWELNYQAVRKFLLERGCLQIPRDTAEHRSMSNWLKKQEQLMRTEQLTQEQTEKMRALPLLNSTGEERTQRVHHAVNSVEASALSG